MTRAREAGLDLVEVDANANPPVCRLLDYGKWKYEQAKKERDARKHQRGTMVHEVRLRPRTGQHDIDLKVRIVERLLAEGDKVKLSVMFRGREMSHPEVGHDVLNRALSKLGEQGLVEKPAGMEGRFLSVILTPTVKKAKPGEESVPAKDGGPGRNSGHSGTNGEVAAQNTDTGKDEAQTSEAQAAEVSASADGLDATEEKGT
jgi:translation initiation factor IF-3